MAVDNQLCSVRGCERPKRASGYCNMHYKRLRLDGTPGEAESRRNWRTRWRTGRPGENYMVVYVAPDDPLYGAARRVGGTSGSGRRTMLEHRYAMAQTLGRPLRPEENVHHINGIKDDNRPENLELWSTSQPSGERVEDKLAWAREILDLYGGLF